MTYYIYFFMVPFKIRVINYFTNLGTWRFYDHEPVNKIYVKTTSIELSTGDRSEFS